MTRTGRAALAAVLLATSLPSARAELSPAGKPGLIPQGAAVIDENGRARDISDFLSGPRPVLLLPIFTRCAGSCPLLLENVKAALARRSAGVAFGVVVFSFDATDTDGGLRSFRRERALPAEWALVRAAQAGGARGFLDQFGFSLMESNGGFIHPDEGFVLSKGGRWCSTVNGGELAPGDLAAASRAAEELDRPSILRSSFADPQAWAVWGFLWLLAVAGGVFVLSLRRSSRL